MGNKERIPQRLEPEIEAAFPNLVKEGYDVTSPQTWDYNCIAYAAGDQTKKWSNTPGYYWPPGAQCGSGLKALISCFEAIGYVRCENDTVEEGYEKVALYADSSGAWQHAAKQLPDGQWSSKLGDYEDIRHHKPDDLNCSDYGQVTCFMKRPIAGGNNNSSIETSGR